MKKRKVGYIHIDFMEDDDRGITVEMNSFASHKILLMHLNLINEYYDVIDKAMTDFEMEPVDARSPRALRNR